MTAPKNWSDVNGTAHLTQPPSRTGPYSDPELFTQADLDAHIGAALAEAADCAYNLKREDWASEDEDWDAGTHDAAVAITALRPTAITALDRAKREARVEGMRAAAAMVGTMQFPIQDSIDASVGLPPVGQRIAAAIRALIEKEGKP